MEQETEKTMFEIYREKDLPLSYRVVYFTELNEANREYEINRAMLGEHFLDGFFIKSESDRVKNEIERILEKLNAGEYMPEIDARLILQPYMVE